MWFEESIVYHIYPLGFCGAPKENDGHTVNRLEKLGDWIPHMARLGIDTLYLGPIFESDRHGYDTRDYAKIDCRLGDSEMFRALCGKLHEAGIRILLDGVFNHVGRGFWAFQDVREKKDQSAYKDWFILSWGRDSNYGDGFWYEGWEGHFELVKLNLRNPAVVDYLLDCVTGWIRDYDIDGLRLDVAYSLDKDFMRRLRGHAKGLKEDFFLLGECLHGDYNQFVGPELLDSCTNYECYKGLHSSFNELNMYEIGYSLNRQFGSENWTIYRGKHLLSFVDNHDVSRIAGILREKQHLPLIYGLMFAMPGIPCVYYGSEWGVSATKDQGDDALRPDFAAPEENALTQWIIALCRMYKREKALSMGDYRQIFIANKQLGFRREYQGRAVIAAVNAGAESFQANLGFSGPATNLLTGEHLHLQGDVTLPPYSFACWTEGHVEISAPVRDNLPESAPIAAAETREPEPTHAISPETAENPDSPAIPQARPVSAEDLIPVLDKRLLEAGSDWVLSRARRTYHMAKLLAKWEGIPCDEAVLAIACYLAEIAPGAGAVKAISRLAEETGLSPEQANAAADALDSRRDADTGGIRPLLLNACAVTSIGAVAIAGEFSAHPGDIRAAFEALKERRRKFAEQISFASAKMAAEPRLREMDSFLRALEDESFGIH